MVNYAYLIPVFPLAAFVINIFFRRFVGKAAAWVSIIASLCATAIALPLAWEVARGGHPHAAEAVWLMLDGHPLTFGLLIDPLAATMLFVVCVIGTLIQIYSTGYMEGDPRYSRFFAFVSLFMAAMLTLVIADNYILFFMAWEIMGLCSYLLIGFYFFSNAAANASKKAFLTTRIGDVLLLLGMLMLFTSTGTLHFSELADAIRTKADHPALIAAALLIFCGTIGKSAQFPLHVWLPDAMEGPTPVSALIHAATMVAAGVFLVARSFVLFEMYPDAMHIVAWIGTITALMAALIALTANDIKKVLAFSTISQLGFMVTAMGLGSMAAGMFHLVTHAFFKALLFMGAGSVIHGTGTQDMRALGGLFGKMKSTALTFLLGSLAIAGVPPFSGFWSKDEILLAAHDHSPIIYGLLSFAAFMTAFYMFRLVFMTFFGKPRSARIHAHESPRRMTIPLWFLAGGAVLIGLPGSPWMHFWFQDFLHHFKHGGEHHVNMGVMISSVLISAAGILLAFVLYLKKPLWPQMVAQRLRPLYNLSSHKFWFDEIYAAWIVRPWHALGRVLFEFDQRVVDGAVNGAGKSTLWTSRLHNWIDKYLVDGLVNLTGTVTQLAGNLLRRVQTGLVQNYMLIMLMGVIVFIFFELR